MLCETRVVAQVPGGVDVFRVRCADKVKHPPPDHQATSPPATAFQASAMHGPPRDLVNLISSLVFPTTIPSHRYASSFITNIHHRQNTIACCDRSPRSHTHLPEGQFKGARIGG